MNVHEHEAKELFQKHGIAVPKGIVIFKPEDASQAAETLIKESGSNILAVKAQIRSGGRGEAGGVKVVKGVAEAQAAATEIFGKRFITAQTDSNGRVCHRVLIEQGIPIKRELYLAAVLDREARRVSVVACPKGGVKIEKVADNSPELIHRVRVESVLGLMPFQERQLFVHMGLEQDMFVKFSGVLESLVRMFMEEDCFLAEINPLVVTKENLFVALDAKMSMGDGARFRHVEWERFRDPYEEKSIEIEAEELGVNYVHFNGNIGCLVNGAGLAMATMDLIRQVGGEPANFLDADGKTKKGNLIKVLRMIISQPQVKGLFVNIFGGIMRVDMVAEALIEASKEVPIDIPLVVRFEGTNVERGRELLDASHLKVTYAKTLLEGAEKIVEMVGKAN